MIVYEPNPIYPYSGGMYRLVDPAVNGFEAFPVDFVVEPMAVSSGASGNVAISLQVHCNRCGEPLPTGGGHICRVGLTVWP